MMSIFRIVVVLLSFSGQVAPIREGTRHPILKNTRSFCNLYLMHRNLEFSGEIHYSNSK